MFRSSIAPCHLKQNGFPETVSDDYSIWNICWWMSWWRRWLPSMGTIPAVSKEEAIGILPHDTAVGVVNQLLWPRCASPSDLPDLHGSCHHRWGFLLINGYANPSWYLLMGGWPSLFSRTFEHTHSLFDHGTRGIFLDSFSPVRAPFSSAQVQAVRCPWKLHHRIRDWPSVEFHAFDLNHLDSAADQTAIFFKCLKTLKISQLCQSNVWRAAHPAHLLGLPGLPCQAGAQCLDPGARMEWFFGEGTISTMPTWSTQKTQHDPGGELWPWGITQLIPSECGCSRQARGSPRGACRRKVLPSVSCDGPWNPVEIFICLDACGKTCASQVEQMRILVRVCACMSCVSTVCVCVWASVASFLILFRLRFVSKDTETGLDFLMLSGKPNFQYPIVGFRSQTIPSLSTQIRANPMLTHIMP